MNRAVASESDQSTLNRTSAIRVQTVNVKRNVRLVGVRRLQCSIFGARKPLKVLPERRGTSAKAPFANDGLPRPVRRATAGL